MSAKAVQRLLGVQDARGVIGIAARGRNVYNGASHAAQSGGGSQYGRPKGRKTSPAVMRAARRRQQMGR